MKQSIKNIFKKYICKAHYHVLMIIALYNICLLVGIDQRAEDTDPVDACDLFIVDRKC